MYNVTITLDAGAKIPMYEQLYRYFVAEIHSGRLKSGEKLPSKRALCSHLGVSRSTVETAYELLSAEGYVFSRPRSGLYVADFAAFGETAGAESHPAAPPAPVCAPEKPVFDFSTASVDTSLFPYSSWAKLNKEVVYSSPELLQRGERSGDLPLRAALADFLAEYRGVRCTPDEIVVGAGIEYLLSLIMQLFGPDAVLGVEDPGYPSAYHTIRASGLGVRLIPLDRDGMSVSALRSSGASVAYTTPSHQFPMGVTMPASRRSQLLRWANSAEARFIIEDDYDSEFRYLSRPVPAMQSMDKSGKVIYIGTFSRSLAPSIRIAYTVLPPELMRRYNRLSGYGLSTVSRYEQAVMARFLAEGYYARYLRRVGNLYRRRRARLVDALSAIDGVSVSGDGGGLHLLVTNTRWSEEELLARAREKGISLTGVSAYCHSVTPPESTLVMGYGGLDDSKTAEAAKLLASAWR